MKYKLVQRRNPMDPEVAPKWYASPMNNEAESLSAMMRSATEDTGTNPVEMQAVFNLWLNHAMRRLINGESVRLGEAGTLRITFKSKGVEDITKFNPSQMIYDVRIIFTPSKDFREGVISEITFENGGVLENGIDYVSLSAYQNAKETALGIDKDTDTGEGGGTFIGSGSMD